MPKVLEWSFTADPDDAVQHVREALSAGQVVLVHTPTTLLALVNPASSNAGTILHSLGSQASVLLAGTVDAEHLGVKVPRLASRLMNRGWPGPLTVVLPTPVGLVANAGWNPAIEASVVRDGEAAFCWPEHPLLDRIVLSLDQPLLLFARPATDLSAVESALGETLGLLIRDPDGPGIAKPTVVRIAGAEWKVLAEGSIPEDVVRHLMARMILFVCTGNTCRSPMAESLAKRLLADQLSCSVDELPGRGYWITSAGVAVLGADAASAGAVEAVAEFGADLAGHESRPVYAQVLADADDVIAMTHSHAAALQMRFPGLGPPVRLLCGGEDLLDPIGGDREVYRECASTIRSHLERLVREWTAS